MDGMQVRSVQLNFPSFALLARRLLEPCVAVVLGAAGADTSCFNVCLYLTSLGHRF